MIYLYIDRKGHNKPIFFPPSLSIRDLYVHIYIVIIYIRIRTLLLVIHLLAAFVRKSSRESGVIYMSSFLERNMTQASQICQ